MASTQYVLPSAPLCPPTRQFVCLFCFCFLNSRCSFMHAVLCTEYLLVTLFLPVSSPVKIWSSFQGSSHIQHEHTLLFNYFPLECWLFPLKLRSLLFSAYHIWHVLPCVMLFQFLLPVSIPDGRPIQGLGPLRHTAIPQAGKPNKYLCGRLYFPKVAAAITPNPHSLMRCKHAHSTARPPESGQKLSLSRPVEQDRVVLHLLAALTSCLWRCLLCREPSLDLLFLLGFEFVHFVQFLLIYLDISCFHHILPKIQC